MRSDDRAPLRPTPAQAAVGLDAARALVGEVRRLRPRVQCLMNTVAQPLVANCLHAIGAGASMASHPDEIIGMARGAGAMVVNLGTPDEMRVKAIERLFESVSLPATLPVVLDPVFVQTSALRMDLARVVARHSRLIIKGNADEIAALRPELHGDAATRAVWITTGRDSLIEWQSDAMTVAGGHAWMADVTGMGCALGAVVAAMAAFKTDDRLASAAALALFAEAGRAAGARASGPGSFAVAFLDELYRLSQEA